MLPTLPSPAPRVLVLATAEGDLLRESHISHRLEVAGFEVHPVADATEVHTLVVSLEIEAVGALFSCRCIDSNPRPNLAPPPLITHHHPFTCSPCRHVR